MLEGGASLLEVLLKLEPLESSAHLSAPPRSTGAPPTTVSSSTKVGTEASDKTRGRSITTTATTLSEEVSTQRKRVNQKVIDRRRRRGQRLALSGSSEEEEEEAESSRRSLSDSSLSMPSDGESEEDIQVLESLSESSGSDQEGLSAPRQQPASSLPSSKVVSGRRQIVLAANFNLAPSKGPPVEERKAKNAESTTLVSVGVADDNTLPKEACSGSVYESMVHLVCSMLAEDSYLVHIKVFTEWLHTYPIVIATCRQVSVYYCIQ